MNRIEEVRAKLQEVDNHVTFAKEEENSTVWYVGDDMEKIWISNDMMIGDIVANRLMKKVLVGLDLL